MQNIIELRITRTGRSYAPTDEWRIFDRTTKRFDDLESAEQWLKEEYYYCKTIKPIYQDTATGTIKVGRLYCFRAQDQGSKWLEQHWVSFYALTIEPLRIR